MSMFITPGELSHLLDWLEPPTTTHIVTRSKLVAPIEKINQKKQEELRVDYTRSPEHKNPSLLLGLHDLIDNGKD